MLRRARENKEITFTAIVSVLTVCLLLMLAISTSLRVKQLEALEIQRSANVHNINVNSCNKVIKYEDGSVVCQTTIRPAFDDRK